MPQQLKHSAKIGSNIEVKNKFELDEISSQV